MRRQWLWHYWEEDKNFNIDNHVLFEQLPGKAGHKEFEAFVSKKLREPLPLDVPLWQQIVISNYTKEDGTVRSGRGGAAEKEKKKGKKIYDL